MIEDTGTIKAKVWAWIATAFLVFVAIVSSSVYVAVTNSSVNVIVVVSLIAMMFWVWVTARLNR